MNLDQRIQEIYDGFILANAKKTDRLFSLVLLIQWFAAVFYAYFSRSNYEQVQTVFLVGGLLSVFPILLVVRHAGRSLNSYVITAAQTLFSVLFIFLSHGRIETHFHIFGSLAFLAFYRNWRTLILSTVMIALAHLLGSIYFPVSFFGESSVSFYHVFEHVGWICFADVFLLYSIAEGLRTLKMVSENQVELLKTIIEVRAVQKKVTDQQQALVVSNKLSSLGEMAGGVAHEINNPLAIIMGISAQMEELLKRKLVDQAKLAHLLGKIIQSSDRIARIVRGLRTFSRDGSQDPTQLVTVNSVIKETLGFCAQRFLNNGIRLTLEPNLDDLCFMGQETQISQVLLNLLNNAYDAVEKTPEPWVLISVNKREQFLEIRVTDSGPGISSEVQEKLFLPFFTTKEIGKGTGMGLSISRKIVDNHQGELRVDDHAPHTCFVIQLPIHRSQVELKNTA